MIYGAADHDDTIDAKPCVACNKPTLSIIEVAVWGNAAKYRGVADGTVVNEIFICRPCRSPKLLRQLQVN